MKIRVIVKAIDDYETGEVFDCDPATAESLIGAGCAEPAGVAPADEGAKTPSLDELKARCRELGLPGKGKKADLAARIAEAEAALADAEGGEPEDDEEPPELSAEVPR